MAIKQAVSGTRGFIYLFRGLKLVLTDRRLFRLSIMPFMVNTVLFILFFLSFNTLAYYLYTWIFTQLTQQWYWAILSGVVVGILLFVVSLLVVLFGFVAVGLIVASPFNDLLSSAVEEKLTGEIAESDQSFAQQALFIMTNETKKMMVFLLCQMALILLNIIPGIGQITFLILNPLFISFVMAYEFMGYTLDRRGFGFTEKKQYIFSQTGMSFGFGGIVGLSLLVPIAHFMLMPAAVAGGTMFVVENAVVLAKPVKLEQE